MQAILDQQETAGRTNFSETRRETAPFTGDSRSGEIRVKRRAVFKSKDAFAATGGDDANVNGRAIIAAMVKSKIYRDYEKAFCEATGMPVTLRPVEFWQLPHHGRRNENPFCQLMSQKNRACSVCMQVQDELSQTATTEAQTITCPIGMCDTAVPVRLGDRLIGFLQTGQVFRKKPTTTQFERTAKLAVRWGLETGREELEEAYFDTKVVSRRQHESVVKLLSIFAEHLSLLGNQLVVQRENSEPPVIARAKEYIHEHQTEELSLGQVAKAVNTSRFYFCKLFKKATGINFTDYLSRVRIERSKNLLLNPNLRVSEIAFEVGFQSLTHFNRVFKKILGQSPTQYPSAVIEQLKVSVVETQPRGEPGKFNL